MTRIDDDLDPRNPPPRVLDLLELLEEYEKPIPPLEIGKPASQRTVEDDFKFADGETCVPDVEARVRLSRGFEHLAPWCVQRGLIRRGVVSKSPNSRAAIRLELNGDSPPMGSKITKKGLDFIAACAASDASGWAKKYCKAPIPPLTPIQIAILAFLKQRGTPVVTDGIADHICESIGYAKGSVSRELGALKHLDLIGNKRPTGYFITNLGRKTLERDREILEADGQ